jgi:hypothetical protein
VVKAKRVNKFAGLAGIGNLGAMLKSKRPPEELDETLNLDPNELIPIIDHPKLKQFFIFKRVSYII